MTNSTPTDDKKKAKPKKEKAIEEPMEIEFHTTEQYILGATNIIIALSEVDAMKKADVQRKQTIINRWIKILDLLSKEYHDELFEETPEADAAEWNRPINGVESEAWGNTWCY